MLDLDVVVLAMRELQSTFRADLLRSPLAKLLAVERFLRDFYVRPDQFVAHPRGDHVDLAVVGRVHQDRKVDAQVLICNSLNYLFKSP